MNGTETRILTASTAGIILAWFYGEALRFGDVVANVSPVIENIRTGWTYRLYSRSRTIEKQTDNPVVGEAWELESEKRDREHEVAQARSDEFDARVKSGEVERPLMTTGEPYPRYYRKESVYVSKTHLADISLTPEAWAAWDKNVESRDMPCLYYP